MNGRQVMVVAMVALLAGAPVAGCAKKNKGPAQRAGEKVDNAVESAGDAVKKAGDKVEDATDK